MLAAIDDPLMRETARDFLKPKRLRFDLFLKGEPASADTNALRQQRFVLAATTTDPATGMFVITGNNIIQPGDSLMFMINTWTMHPAQIKVSTSFQGSPVSLTASITYGPGVTSSWLCA